MAAVTPRSSAKTNSAGRPLGVRELAAQATRDNILRAAIKVFAKHGGSVGKISKAAKSVDRMIYYYFGNKGSSSRHSKRSTVASMTRKRRSSSTRPSRSSRCGR